MFNEYTIIFQEGIQLGLRNSPKTSKRAEVLIKSDGFIPENNILRTLTLMDDFGAELDCDWPFPQMFTLQGITLVCTPTVIYDYNDGSLVELFVADAAGTTWSVGDFWPYVIMTNGLYIVQRNPETGVWGASESCDIPFCVCLCEANGQIIMGGPETRITSGVL